MITLVSVNGQPNSANYKEFVYENDNEVQELPTDVAVGSWAMKIDGSAIYRFSSNLEWIEVT